MNKIANCQIKQLNSSFLEKEVQLTGWIVKTVKLAKVVFCQLRDATAEIQVCFVRANFGDQLNSLLNLNKESVLQVNGLVKTRNLLHKQRYQVPFELLATSWKILNPSAPLPFLITDQTDGQEKIRMQYRYLDLRRRPLQALLIKRAKLQALIRQFMQENEILEINTPLLSFQTAEGAKNFVLQSPVVPINYQLALPQSPQIYKQLLMTAGFKSYYQLAHCFRDEKLRADRQPEFMQLDLELAFVPSQTVCHLIERLLVRIWRQFKNVTLSTPFKKISYDLAWNEYGSDKPDCRFELKLQDLTALFARYLPKDHVFKFLQPDRALTKKELNRMTSRLGKQVATKFFLYQAHQVVQVPTTWSSSLVNVIENYLQTHQIAHFYALVDLLPQTNFLLGKLRLFLGATFNLIPSTVDELLWVVNPPLFVYDPTNKQYQPVHHPFTHPLDLAAFRNNPRTARADAYDLIINGIEVASGTKRIFDATMQRKIFTIMGMSAQTQTTEYGFFFQAMEFGMPPHAGIGLGIARLLQALTGVKTIRDLIAFPKASAFDTLFLDREPKTVPKKAKTNI